MLILTEKAIDVLKQVREYADKAGIRDKLEDKLDYLTTFGGKHPEDHPLAGQDACRVELYGDFADLSFSVVWFQRRASWATASERSGGMTLDGEMNLFMFNGGMIFSGPNQPLDGSSPAFCVGIGTPSHGWSIHT